MLTGSQGDELLISHLLTVGVFNGDGHYSGRASCIHQSEARIDVRETGPESIGSLLLTNSGDNKAGQIRAAGGNADACK